MIINVIYIDLSHLFEFLPKIANHGIPLVTLKRPDSWFKYGKKQIPEGNEWLLDSHGKFTPYPHTTGKCPLCFPGGDDIRILRV